MHATSKRNRDAFTLIELVVVVVIIAILVSVSVPIFSDRAADARKSAMLKSLSGLRSAVEFFRCDSTGYPLDLPSDLARYLDGPFPSTKVAGVQSNAVLTINANRPLQSSDVTSTGGWIYNSVTGEVRINHGSLFMY